MDSRAVAVIVLACVFGSAMLGFLLGKKLSDRHLDDRSKDIVKLSTGLIATLCAVDAKKNCPTEFQKLEGKTLLVVLGCTLLLLLLPSLAFAVDAEKKVLISMEFKKTLAASVQGQKSDPEFDSAFVHCDP